jgi:hypothetical protein
MKMKNVICFGLMAAAALALCSAHAQPTSATPSPASSMPVSAPTSFSPSVGEVVKLAQSGVGDDVVVAYVKNSSAVYNLSANDILALKDAAVSAPVISAMLTHDSSLRSQPARPTYEQQLYAPANPPPAIPNAPTVPTAQSVPTAPSVAPAPTVQPVPPQPPPPTPAAIVEQAPPPPQVEVVPISPGPDYYWVPGYWSWNGTWAWVGGSWAFRPHPGAVWIGGHWGRHGRGYIWIGGRWR